jgi:hypothetical protein
LKELRERFTDEEIFDSLVVDVEYKELAVF